MNLQRLTATEARIAGLIASGYNDREITAQLALPAQACERHLTEIYRKLGIHSRTEVALLLGQGPAHPSEREQA